MPDDFEIQPFLTLDKAEVTRMYVTEYDHDKALAEWKEEGREEGGVIALVILVREGLLTLEQAAERVSMTIPEFKLAAESAGETLDF